MCPSVRHWSYECEIELDPGIELDSLHDERRHHRRPFVKGEGCVSVRGLADPV
jgi:hypothetical protein